MAPEIQTNWYEPRGQSASPFDSIIPARGHWTGTEASAESPIASAFDDQIPQLDNIHSANSIIKCCKLPRKTP